VRELKAAKAPKDEITAAVDALLALKAEKANSPFAAGPRGSEGEGTGEDTYIIVSDTDGTYARQPGQPFSEVEAKTLVSAARERLEAGGAFRDRVITIPLCYKLNLCATNYDLDAAGVFRDIDARTQRTVSRILKAFREARVGPHLFGGTDGYGHGDMGRETLDEIYAKLFGAEAALVRRGLVSCGGSEV
jgi:hypothetical protein